jgi:hypothetical protein
LPEETEKVKVNSKCLLYKRRTKTWFNIAGAHIQGEIHTKKNLEIELHGRAIVVMPNFFVLAATFEHNKLVDGHYMMLDMIQPSDTSTFERKFTANHFPLLVNNSKLLNKYLFDGTSLFKYAAINAFSSDNREVYEDLMRIDYSSLIPSTVF